MELINIMKALSDETRLRIINILKNGELCVGEIENLLEINQSNASRHLNKLTSIKIVDYYKKAQYVYYKLNEQTLTEHSFIKDILSQETIKIKKFEDDINKLNEYKKSCMTCEDLKLMKKQQG